MIFQGASSYRDKMCKFGVVGFVKSLAVRLAPEKIRVNAICPGLSAVAPY